MSSPRWGRFMEKVYADKTLGYGSVKTFDVPLEMKSDPISADPAYIIKLDKGVDDLNDDGGSTNGDANDFFGDDPDMSLDTSTYKPEERSYEPTPKPQPEPKKGEEKPKAVQPALPADKVKDKPKPKKPEPKSDYE